jgi:hypothetical protein
MHRDYYHSLRQRFLPETVKLAVVAESPPASGKYFYDQTGAITEPLFSAFMRHLRISPLTKEQGLREFQKSGWILIDATYEPVDKLSPSARDQVIVRDYPLLLEDLARLVNKQTRIVLIKRNVCSLLEPRLERDGYRVINQGNVIYFPSHGRQKTICSTVQSHP